MFCCHVGRNHSERHIPLFHQKSAARAGDKHNNNFSKDQPEDLLRLEEIYLYEVIVIYIYIYIYIFDEDALKKVPNC